MKQDDKQTSPTALTYDMIVIGSGESSKSAVQALHDQGQNALLIDLTPDMIASMICHLPKQGASTTQSDQQQQDTESTETKIHLQKQSIHTTTGETITYTFHVENVPTAEYTAEASTSLSHQQEPKKEEKKSDLESTYPFLNWSKEMIDTDTMELNAVKEMMNQPVETTISDNLFENLPTFQVSENDLGIKIDDTNPFEEVTIVDEIEEDIEIVEEEQINPGTDYYSLSQTNKHVVEEIPPHFTNTSQNLTVDSIQQQLKPSLLSQEKVKEVSEREEILSRKENELPPGPQPNLFAQFQSPEMEQSETLHTNDAPTPMTVTSQEDQSSFLDSVLSKPTFTPRESRLRKRMTQKPKQQTEDPPTTVSFQNPKLIPAPQPYNIQQQNPSQIKPLNQYQPAENEYPPPQEQSQFQQPTNFQPQQQQFQPQQLPVANGEQKNTDQKVYSIEPFSTRRRARAQKKSRMLSTVERFQGNVDAQDQQPPPQAHNKQMISNTEPIHPFVEQSTFQQPVLNKAPQFMHQEDEFAMDDPFGQDTGSLKSDNIEFEEDPYGYNSWEEFMYPPSQNNRKRQGMDQIEKRKIALRGLHNLINNLG